MANLTTRELHLMVWAAKCRRAAEAGKPRSIGPCGCYHYPGVDCAMVVCSDGWPIADGPVSHLAPWHPAVSR